MIYTDGYEVDEISKVAIECPKCGNSEIEEDDNHCKICGVLIINNCTSSHLCNHRNPGNARYCVKCGSETHFKLAGILDDWEVARDKIMTRKFLEFRIGKEIKDTPYIENWNSILMSLNKKEFELLIMCLEGSKAKIISETLVVYVKNAYVKEMLVIKELFNTMINSILEHPELEFSKVAIKSPGDDLKNIEIFDVDLKIPF